MTTSTTSAHTSTDTENQMQLPLYKEVLDKLVNKYTQFNASNVNQDKAVFDRSFIVIALVMYMIGLIMVASSSMPVAERLFNNPFHFVIRHAIYIVLSLGIAGVALQIPMAWWQKNSSYLLIFGIFLLVTVLLIGRSVNGCAGLHLAL